MNTPTTYNIFIEKKLHAAPSFGIDPAGLRDKHLFEHQTAISAWAARKGRAAIFADTGLGKTRMELAWADLIHRVTHDTRADSNILILAPLAVAEQTVAEGTKIGLHVTHARDGADIQPGINITNYERLHRFNPGAFCGCVLDESSIIKHHDAKTFAQLCDFFTNTDYRLCATATPAPNDWTELGTHAEFLGVCTRAEMLAEYFVHDGGSTQDWRLKGHARNAFWKWVATWGAMIRSPADLGFDASAYDLPPLHVEQISVASDSAPDHGELFVQQAQTLNQRRQARRDSLRHRVAACTERVNATDTPWIVWCELNAEGDALRAAIPDATEIRGADSTEHKERALRDFAAGHIRVLITKPKIAGFGLNWQHCHNVAFVGVTDSWESYYQAVRRCWRFGQTQPVKVQLFVSEQEGAVKNNLERKEAAALAMLEALSNETRNALCDEVLGQPRISNDYQPHQQMEIPPWLQSAA